MLRRDCEIRSHRHAAGLHPFHTCENKSFYAKLGMCDKATHIGCYKCRLIFVLFSLFVLPMLGERSIGDLYDRWWL